MRLLPFSCQGTKETSKRKMTHAIERRVEALRDKHEDLKQRLIRVMRMLEVVEAKSFRLGPLTKEETALKSRLSSLSKRLKPGSSPSLPQRVESLSNKVRTKINAPSGQDGGGFSVNKESLDRLNGMLSHHMRAVRHVTDTVKRDDQALQELEKESGPSDQR